MVERLALHYDPVMKMTFAAGAFEGGYVSYADYQELERKLAVIPDGWRLVPIEPTSQMVEQGSIRQHEWEACETVADIYNLFRKQWANALAAALSAAHPADGWRDIPVTDDLISYVRQYGGRCRDCGDVAGICSSGLPCEAEDAAKAIRCVLGAINYGFRHGYLSFPAAPAAKPEGE